MVVFAMFLNTVLTSLNYELVWGTQFTVGLVPSIVANTVQKYSSYLFERKKKTDNSLFQKQINVTSYQFKCVCSWLSVALESGRSNSACVCVLQVGGRVGAGEGREAHKARGDRVAGAAHQGGAVRAVLQHVHARGAARALPPRALLQLARAVPRRRAPPAHRARAALGRPQAQARPAPRRERLLALRPLGATPAFNLFVCVRLIPI